MTLRYDDRCKVSATNPGTGAIPAASAAVAGGFIQLSAIKGITNGDIVPYMIVSGSLFEGGYGTWNSSTGLARTTVTSNSSRTNANINFTGAVTVQCDALAASLALADQNGQVSNPNIRFQAHLGSNFSPSLGSWTKILWDTIDFDTASGWDATDHWWVVPFTGWYEVSAMMCSTGTPVIGADQQLSITKNGLTAAGGTQIIDGSFGVLENSNAIACSTPIPTVECYLTAGDKIEADCNINGSPGMLLQGSSTLYTYLRMAYSHA